MFKTYFFIALSFLAASCGKSSHGDSNSSAASDSNLLEQTGNVDTSTAAVAAHEASRWDARISLISFTKTQEDKVQDAIDLIKQVIASDEFKNKVINYTYGGKKTFVDNGGYTNAQIYQKILEGSEKLNPGKNYRMDLTIGTYYTSANVIGYTLPTANQIWMNTRYLNNFTPVQVASNMMHEWLHKLGFKHDYASTPSRPYSVPYAVGYIMKALAAKYY